MGYRTPTHNWYSSSDSSSSGYPHTTSTHLRSEFEGLSYRHTYVSCIESADLSSADLSAASGNSPRSQITAWASTVNHFRNRGFQVLLWDYSVIRVRRIRLNLCFSRSLIAPQVSIPSVFFVRLVSHFGHIANLHCICIAEATASLLPVSCLQVELLTMRRSV